MDPYEELRRVKERIAEMERFATAAPLESLLADHYSPTKPPKDHAARDMENLARYYSPDEEAAFRQREKVGAEKYDAAVAAAHGDLLGQAISLAAAAAHAEIKKGTSNE
jgi:hypothetical protein